MDNLNEKKFRRNGLSIPSKQYLENTISPTSFKSNLVSSGIKSMKAPRRRVKKGRKLINTNVTNSKRHPPKKLNWMKKARKIRQDKLKIKLLLRKLKMIYL